MWGVKVLIGKRRALLRVWDITKKDKRNLWYGLHEYEQYHKKEKKKRENKERESKQ